MRTAYLFVIFLCLASVSALAIERDFEKKYVCFITTAGINVSVDALREGYLYASAELAFKNFKQQHSFSTARIKHLPVDGNDTALLTLLNSLDPEKCFVVVGLITSRESLLAAPILKKKNIFTISSTASHPALEVFSKHFFSAVNSADDFIAAIASAAQPADSDIFIIKYSEDIYSEYYARSLSNKLKQRAKVLSVGTKGLLSTEQLLEISLAHKPIVIVTALALPSLPIVAELISRWPRDKALKVIGSPSWALDPVTFAGKQIASRPEISMYFPVGFDPNSKEYKQLFVAFKKRNHINPQPNVAYAYDAVMMALKCLNASDFNFCVRNLNYRGWTGHYSYDVKSVFPKKKISIYYLLDFLSGNR